MHIAIVTSHIYYIITLFFAAVTTFGQRGGAKFLANINRFW